MPRQPHPGTPSSMSDRELKIQAILTKVRRKSYEAERVTNQRPAFIFFGPKTYYDIKSHADGFWGSNITADNKGQLFVFGIPAILVMGPDDMIEVSLTEEVN